MLITKKMISSIIIFFVSLLLFSCSKNESESRVIEQDVKIYLVALEGSELPGKMFGCNDILVTEEIKISAERSVLEATFYELVNFKSTGELINFVKGPGLMLVQVTVARGIADVYLTGDFEISGACDIIRIKEQIYETAKQFTEYTKINFYIKNETLENYLDVAGASFK